MTTNFIYAIADVLEGVIDAQVGDQAHVWDYRPIGDEHGWVTDTEYFDDLDDPVTVKRQRWQLVDECLVTFHPTTELCSECHGEGEHDTGQGAWACQTCDGDGRHPMAGQQEVLP